MQNLNPEKDKKGAERNVSTFNNLHKSLPFYSDTKVLFELGLQVGAFSAIHQILVSKWVSGERVILATRDLGLLNDEGVRALVSGAMLCEENSEMIVERIEDFTVVSYNFAEVF